MEKIKQFYLNNRTTVNLCAVGLILFMVIKKYVFKK